MHRLSLILALATAALTTTAHTSRGQTTEAQAPQAQSRPEAPGHVADSSDQVNHRLSGRAALLSVGGLALATVAIMPFDSKLESAIRTPSVQSSSLIRGSARVANIAGDPGVLILSAAMYGVGKLGRRGELADIGLHSGEAIVMGGATTAVIKLLAGRQRPYVEAGDAGDFSPARGTYAGRSSFPSGHTTAAFAFASAAAAEINRHHPTAARIATPLLYAGATSVGLARMYDDKHWASDVILGAGIGTLIGTQWVAFAHRRRNSWVDRHIGEVGIAPLANGWTVVVNAHRANRSPRGR